MSDTWGISQDKSVEWNSNRENGLASDPPSAIHIVKAARASACSCHLGDIKAVKSLAWEPVCICYKEFLRNSLMFEYLHVVEVDYLVWNTPDTWSPSSVHPKPNVEKEQSLCRQSRVHITVCQA